MPKRLRKKPADVNALAFAIVAEATAEKPTMKEKHPGAVALGKLGGAKGGKKRAAGMSAEERRAAAQKAAQARWSKSKG